MDIKYVKNPVVLSILGSFVYYLLEKLDCYVNARKTSSLNRRTIIVFLILISSLYFVTMEEKSSHSEIFTDIGNF
jgi:hypothetical protein